MTPRVQATEKEKLLVEMGDAESPCTLNKYLSDRVKENMGSQTDNRNCSENE